MRIYNKSVGIYQSLVHCGERCNTLPDRLCASILALCPILQYYIGVVDDAGITLLILVMPWFALRLVQIVLATGRIPKSTVSVLGLIVFLVYRSVIHDPSIKALLYNFALIVLFLAAAIKCINLKQFFTTSSYVASAACIIVMVQTVVYYLTRRHLQVVPTNLFTEEAWVWILLAKTGIIGVTQVAGDLYRPSAFFMEPSHMFLYVFPHLFMMLLSPNMDKRKMKRAILYTLGLVFTTSGMGVMATAGAWGLYCAFSGGFKNILHIQHLKKKRNLLLVIFFVSLAILAVVCVPFVQESILRFLDLSAGGAIAGRTRLSTELLKTLDGLKFWIGMASTTEGISFNMSGFAATMYKFGVIGIFLSYWTYAYGVFHLKGQYFWISLLVVIVSFFSAQTHGTFYLMYYVFYIMEGLDDLSRRRYSEKIV